MEGMIFRDLIRRRAWRGFAALLLALSAYAGSTDTSAIAIRPIASQSASRFTDPALSRPALRRVVWNRSLSKEVHRASPLAFSGSDIVRVLLLSDAGECSACAGQVPLSRSRTAQTSRAPPQA